MDRENEKPVVPVHGGAVPARTKTIYPKPHDQVTQGRAKRALGNPFGIDQFGVNQTTLAPGSATALLHYHTAEDEMIYVLEGEVTLVQQMSDGTKQQDVLTSGMAAGFKAGVPIAHQIINKSSADAVILEIGSRRLSVDRGVYPGLDLAVEPDGKGGRRFTHEDGSPIEPDPS